MSDLDENEEHGHFGHVTHFSQGPAAIAQFVYPEFLQVAQRELRELIKSLQVRVSGVNRHQGGVQRPCRMLCCATCTQVWTSLDQLRMSTLKLASVRALRGECSRVGVTFTTDDVFFSSIVYTLFDDIDNARELMHLVPGTDELQEATIAFLQV